MVWNSQAANSNIKMLYLGHAEEIAKNSVICKKCELRHVQGIVVTKVAIKPESL